MSTRVCILFILTVAYATSADCWSQRDSTSNQPRLVSPLFNQWNTIPDGYSFRIAGISSPANLGESVGSLTLTLGGMLEVAVRHEGLLGSPVGRLTPTNEIGVRMQLLSEQSGKAGVSVFFNMMTQTQGNLLGNADLAGTLPGIYNMAVESMAYDAKTMVAGIAFSTTVNPWLSVGGALGVRDVWWKQQFTKYRVPVSLPTTSDGWTFPLAEQTSYNLHWSVNLAARITSNLQLLGEVRMLPFMDIDESTYLLTARQGIEAAVSLAYTVAPGIDLLLLDRWFSEGGSRTHYHEIRLGVSVTLGGL